MPVLIGYLLFDRLPIGTATVQVHSELADMPAQHIFKMNQLVEGFIAPDDLRLRRQQKHRILPLLHMLLELIFQIQRCAQDVFPNIFFKHITDDRQTAGHRQKQDRLPLSSSLYP